MSTEGENSQGVVGTCSKGESLLTDNTIIVCWTSHKQGKLLGFTTWAIRCSKSLHNPSGTYLMQELLMYDCVLHIHLPMLSHSQGSDCTCNRSCSCFIILPLFFVNSVASQRTNQTLVLGFAVIFFLSFIHSTTIGFVILVLNFICCQVLLYSFYVILFVSEIDMKDISYRMGSSRKCSIKYYNTRW